MATQSPGGERGRASGAVVATFGDGEKLWNGVVVRAILSCVSKGGYFDRALVGVCTCLCAHFFPLGSESRTSRVKNGRVASPASEFSPSTLYGAMALCAMCSMLPWRRLTLSGSRNQVKEKEIERQMLCRVQLGILGD